jgi:glutathione synthase/RimK-type ligase-like ATP-grasp enzyme
MTSINKLKSYRKFRAAKVNIPLYTSDAELAAQWIEQGHAVVCRARLEGKDGEGIVVAKKGEHELEPSKLYCQFIPNKREFRAYVWQGEVFEVIEKKRKDLKNYDKYIRSSSRGWVHCKDPTNVPSGILPVAAAATKAIGLDFAGVDLITTDTEAYVLEVNTAPGIYGTTVTMLRDRVLKYAKEMQNAM